MRPAPTPTPTALFSGKATDVLAKQADGHWLMILDGPVEQRLERVS
jgi:ketosteroid isomerase-like protein